MSAAGMKVSCAADVESMGSILGVWAHPDDETYLAGGLMSLAAEAGNRVVCATATKGELGDNLQRWSAAQLGERRTAELAQCLDILGVREHHWLGYRDGDCENVNFGDAVGRLSALIDEIRPQTVLTFGPDGQTGHPDHRAVSLWSTAAFKNAAPRGSRLLYAAVGESWATRWNTINKDFNVFREGFPVTAPDHLLYVNLELRERVLARKFEALRAQDTQTADIVTGMGVETFCAWVADESFVLGRVKR